MKIYTGFGDQGRTRLFGGQVVDKDHLRIQVYGTLDELNSILGLVGTMTTAGEFKKYLMRIQDHLFRISATLATPDDSKTPLNDLRIGKRENSFLEKTIDRIEADLPGLKNFILPGGTQAAAWFHIARTVARRAERHLITLTRSVKPEPEIQIYLNRLSDLLFVLARAENYRNAVSDTAWKPERKSKR